MNELSNKEIKNNGMETVNTRNIVLNDDKNKSSCDVCLCDMNDPYIELIQNCTTNAHNEDATKIQMTDTDFYSIFQQYEDKEPHKLYSKTTLNLPKGAVIHFSGASDKMTREDIFIELTKLGADIAFIDYQRGETEGWVRLTKINAARDFLKSINTNTIVIVGTEVVFRVLAGKEQKSYLKRITKIILQRHQQYKGLDRKLWKQGYKYVKKIN